ncbi:MAG: transcriptional regulator [Candidatus Melainabacteria bacterium HGW-Melainabacteria-1]|nr:MAG: transcriptional regulator [Candidatus Melainabacteria bacterium HGW-Melainabacteria-1]
MGLKWKLRQLMRERRITNKQLAESIGVHRNTVLLLKEDHPTMIRMKYLESLCKVLKCQPSDLIEFDHETATH